MNKCNVTSMDSQSILCVRNSVLSSDDRFILQYTTQGNYSTSVVFSGNYSAAVVSDLNGERHMHHSMLTNKTRLLLNS